MLLRMRVRAGVLLYALLMSAVFALLLNFYMERVLAMERQAMAQVSASQAYLMAEVTKDLATDDAGGVTFNQGRASYSRKSDQLAVKVLLDNGQSFSYQFTQSKQEEVEEEQSEAEHVKEEKSSRESSADK